MFSLDHAISTRNNAKLTNDASSIKNMLTEFKSSVVVELGASPGSIGASPEDSLSWPSIDSDDLDEKRCNLKPRKLSPKQIPNK